MGGIRTKVVVSPHSSSPRVLAEQARVYRSGRTPVIDAHGQVRALDTPPADARVAGRHLDEVATRHGDDGVARSVHGLQVTRGHGFASTALRHAQWSGPGSHSLPAGASGQSRGSAARAVAGGCLAGETPAQDIVGARIGATAAATIQRSTASGGVPVSLTSQLGDGVASHLPAVRIHRDPAAHEAARMLGARAFTIGSSIYFGEGQYQPGSADGARLIAHELAHTVQQAGAQVPRLADVTVGSPSSPEEHEADRFADATGRGERAPEIRPRTSTAARAMRVISFTRSNDVFTRNHPQSAETATTFQIAQGAPAAPHFRWDADVTIHGNPGDPFANFEVGPLQVVRAFWLQIEWRHGAIRTRRRSRVTTPIRDAIAAADIWYATPLVSAPFGAAGDVRSTNLNDTPGVTGQPFANPLGHPGTRGDFMWGMAFVAFISARDIAAGAGAAAFRHLGHVYWNLSLAGNFNTARAVGSRIRITDGGRTNIGGVIAGRSGDFPAMHGGAIFNDEANANLTTV